MPDRQVLINPPGRALGSLNAILSTTAPRYHVDRFAGPLSIKWMVSGWGLWRTDERAYRVDPGCYLVLNQGRVYSLTIELEEPRESFCPFFARGFVEDAHRALITPEVALLDEPYRDHHSPLPAFEHLYPSDAWVTPQLRRMRDAVRSGAATAGWLDQEFYALGERLLRAQGDVRRSIERVPAARPATRAELFRRLHTARDFMHAHFAEPLPLGTIARAACLSPHHFHRLFRRLFAETPHRYVTSLRMSRAKALLVGSDVPVTEICFAAGFESLGSFSTRFRREVGMSPARFRADARAKNSKVGEAGGVAAGRIRP